MTIPEKITRNGKDSWVEREITVGNITKGEELVKTFSIYDSKFPPDMSEKVGALPVIEGENVRVDLTKKVNKPLPYWHRNLDYDEVIFVVKGKVKWYTEVGTYELKEGDVLIIPRGIAHRNEPIGETNYIALEIKLRDAKCLTCEK